MTLDEFLNEQLKDPEFKREYDALEGWYQQEGEEPRKLHAGDVAVARNGVKHWHGAAADSWLSHIVVNAGEAVWGDPVTDEEYPDSEKYR